jgi:chaperonin GroES
MKIRPLWDNVLIRRAEAPTQSSTGLFLPPSQEPDVIAEVVAVGRGKLLDNGSLLEPEVRAGDRIVLHKYAGHEITIDGVKHYFVKGEDILAVL